MKRILTFATILVGCGCLIATNPADDDPPTERVTPWTSSRIKGTPEPPLPYRIERVFANVKLEQPTEITWLPDADRWIATQLDGQILSFENDPDSAVAERCFNLNDVHPGESVRAYATAFHHDLEHQPWCYIVYSLGASDRQGTHLTRFQVADPTLPTIDPSTRTVLASWNSEGHSGGSMRFGPDGYFYVSVGDGQNPYPPDALNTGQDLSDFEASILRIDVDNPSPDQPYRIPADNPFVGQPHVRDEIWAFGFRNPWKLAFHPETGDLLAADVGWEMREMIYRVQRGGNYGWSIMEGSQPVKQDQQPKIPITPPLFEHTHIDSRSITGGFFWQSDRLPELQGAYIYGDWMTGKVWALKSVGDRVLWHKELVDTPLQIICFMLDPDGEVLIVGYDGTIARLQPNAETARLHEFPRRLSETGLFTDVARQQSAPGVVEYEISAHHWADGTHSRQWIAVPGDEQLSLLDRDDWQTGQIQGRFDFPHDTVLAKTVSYFTETSPAVTERHLETQILHRYGDDWRAYNFIWDDQQADAVLQDDIATERPLVMRDESEPEDFRRQTWHHSSRSECLLCHIWSAGTVHGFAPDQLNITWPESDQQLPRLKRMGLFGEAVPVQSPIAAPHDIRQPLEARARSYLALNCSTCHRPQGGGTANFNFDHTQSLANNKYVDALPAQGTFNFPDARILAPGDPYRSVMLYRILKSGRGHMPQFGSNVIDRRGADLLRDWIASMTPAISGDAQATVDSSHWDKAMADLKASNSPAEHIAALLASASGALALCFACNDGQFPDELRAQIVAAGVAHGDGLVRDLFEHFLPEDQRVKRLGPSVDEVALLATPGAAERGQGLFEQAKDVNCRLCHRIGQVGEALGPDLSGIGTQQTPAELLSSILRPSDKIDAKFRTRTVATLDGIVLTGIVLKEDEEQLSLADGAGKVHTILTRDIEVMQPSAKSVMPEMLLAGMTAQQAADLLVFLGTQRKPGPLQHKHATIGRTRQPMVIDGRRDESAWELAAPVGDFVFTWWNESDGPRQQTDARLLWDDEFLYVCFHCLDTNILATRTERDSDVYRDDCVEVFASPEIAHPENYFNLEMNALGGQLDNYRPDGKNPDVEWNPAGIQVAVTLDGTLNDASDQDRGWTLEVAIPFRLFTEVLPAGQPHVGDRWRLNLNRLEDNMAVKSQWSRGDRNRPSFHAPEFFGFVEFGE